MNKQPTKTTLADGTVVWHVDGKLHREDGPAIENTNGNKSWWINGDLHREDGPAIENTNGYREWWINGKLHREDGPAIENTNGNKSWWINGHCQRSGGIREIEEGDGMILLGTPIDLMIEGVGRSDKWDFVLPPGFQLRKRNNYIVFAESEDGLAIAASCALYKSTPWIHASCSRRGEMPSYADLRDLKEIVFGADRPACQVFAPAKEHVNIHPTCLHLWGPLKAEHWPMPDFTKGMGTI